MGTFHSFVSEPLYKKEDAEKLLNDVKEIIINSDYRNDVENFHIVTIKKWFIVVGIYKNLGNIPVELMKLTTENNWATVSDENDFYSSNSE